MEIAMTIPDEICKRFMHAVEAVAAVHFQGYAAYLGGGCLRDVYAGKPLAAIKDYDIFLIPPSESQGDIEVKGLQNGAVLSAESIPDMRKRGVNCLIWWYDAGIEYNFIVYGRYLSAFDLADDMDMGICQAMYPFAYVTQNINRLIVSEHFVSDHREGRIKSYHQYKASRMAERYDRMHEKFPAYTMEGRPEMVVYAKDGRLKKMKAHY